MKMQYMEYIKNSLTYQEYVSLRSSVGWNNFAEEQAVKAISNSIQNFYFKKGFKLIPHEFCGSGMRKIIRK